MKTLNEDLLISIVDDFLKPFGCDSDFDTDFSYDPEDEKIYFSIAISERASRLYKEYVKKTFHFNISNIFIMCLLHEVGHFFTLHTFSKMRLQAAHEAKEIIEEALEMDDDDDIYSLYFDLSIEKVATAWAISYYKANKKYCEDFYLKFENALMDEYKRLGVIK